MTSFSKTAEEEEEEMHGNRRCVHAKKEIYQPVKWVADSSGFRRHENAKWILLIRFLTSCVIRKSTETMEHEQVVYARLWSKELHDEDEVGVEKSGREKGKEKKPKQKQNTIRTGGAGHLVLFTPGARLGKRNKHVLRPHAARYSLATWSCQSSWRIRMINEPVALQDSCLNHTQSKKLGLQEVQRTLHFTPGSSF